ncbi:MAG: hypothetical protein KAI15_09940, partial [Gammaproteobacteria bacterium]|nr:hypothetical protein [Gammaproteobacteria bacterium]
YFDTRHPTSKKRKPPCQPLKADIPQCVINTMKDDRMHAGVTGQNVPGGSCGWITIKNATYIFTNTNNIFLNYSEPG